MPSLPPSSPKPPPDSPAPSSTEPKRRSDEPDLDDSDDSDAFGPRINALVEMLGDAALIYDGDDDNDPLLAMMRSMDEERDPPRSRQRTIH